MYFCKQDHKTIMEKYSHNFSSFLSPFSGLRPSVNSYEQVSSSDDTLPGDDPSVPTLTLTK